MVDEEASGDESLPLGCRTILLELLILESRWRRNNDGFWKKKIPLRAFPIIREYIGEQGALGEVPPSQAARGHDLALATPSGRLASGSRWVPLALLRGFRVFR